MGMFDEYRPKPAVACPYCGCELTEWQGKNGACALFVWQQGLAMPIEQMASENCRLPDDKIAHFRLPETFRFYHFDAKCRFCPGEAIGYVENEVWTFSTFILSSDAPYNEIVDSNDAQLHDHSWRRKD